MNLKLNNDGRTSLYYLSSKATLAAVKEERRRTGRYIAILVGILLFLLAIYHAWMRRSPVVASLVVPALVMFIYVGWVLFTANKDKKKALRTQALRNAILHDLQDNVLQDEQTSHNVEIIVESNSESHHHTPKSEVKPSTLPGKRNISSKHEKIYTDSNRDNKQQMRPIILINNKIPINIGQNLVMNSTENKACEIKINKFQNTKRFKRKYCRRKRNDVFKRSYSIA